MANAIVAFEGWGASGVGWGSQGWGVGHTDVTATGAVGSLTVSAGATVFAVGVEASGVVGTVAVVAAANVFPTGVKPQVKSERLQSLALPMSR